MVAIAMGLGATGFVGRSPSLVYCRFPTQSGFSPLRLLERKPEAFHHHRGAPWRRNFLLHSRLSRRLVPLEPFSATGGLEAAATLAGTQARGGSSRRVFAKLGGMGIPLLHAFAFQASHLFSARNCPAQHPDGAGLAGGGQAGAFASAGLANGRICFVLGHRCFGGCRVALMAL